MSDPGGDLGRFYALLAKLAALPLQGDSLSTMTGYLTWPRRGVYFFREQGEFRYSQPDVLRVVRVGTHAVSAGSKTSLWNRLRNHRGGRNGGGNHRGSIFRLHVGAALLGRDGASQPTWGIGSSATRVIRESEFGHEVLVSNVIGAMSVLWLDVDDVPGPQSMRAYIERNSIALLSNRLCPRDKPSEGWLGRFSSRDEIRRSGLWNLNFVQTDYDASFLDTFETYVEKMSRGNFV